MKDGLELFSKDNLTCYRLTRGAVCLLPNARVEYCCGFHPRNRGRNRDRERERERGGETVRERERDSERERE